MRYEVANTVEEAVAILGQAESGLYPLAGGTDLLAQIRSGRVAPDGVVDLKRIPELREIVADDAGYRIGAAVSGAELGECLVRDLARSAGSYRQRGERGRGR